MRMVNQIMNDTDLLAAVAEKAGLIYSKMKPSGLYSEGLRFTCTNCDYEVYNHRDSFTPARCKKCGGKEYPWLTSTDACLKLLDKEKRQHLLWDPEKNAWQFIYDKRHFTYAKTLDDVPRAILLTFWEAAG